jgi:hypothetical protein
LCILGVDTLLQLRSVIVGDRLEVGILQSVLNRFPAGIVEDQVGCALDQYRAQIKKNSYIEEKAFKFAQQRKKMLKFKIDLLYSPKTFLLQCPRRCPSRRTNLAPSETRNVQLPHDRAEEPSLGTGADTWYPTPCLP